MKVNNIFNIKEKKNSRVMCLRFWINQYMKEIFVEKEKNNFKVLKVINIISVLYTFMRFVSVWIGNKDKKKCLRVFIYI